MADDEETSNTSSGMDTERSEAEEVKERVKEKVAKGVAAVAGALKGFTEEAKKDDLAGSTKQALQKAGETTRELAGTAKKEFQQTKETVTSGAAGRKAEGSSSMGMGGSTLGEEDEAL